MASFSNSAVPRGSFASTDGPTAGSHGAPAARLAMARPGWGNMSPGDFRSTPSPPSENGHCAVIHVRLVSPPEQEWHVSSELGNVPGGWPAGNATIGAATPLSRASRHLANRPACARNGHWTQDIAVKQGEGCVRDPCANDAASRVAYWHNLAASVLAEGVFSKQPGRDSALSTFAT